MHVAGGQVVLPVWHGERGVPKDRDTQPRSLHLRHEVQTSHLEVHTSISDC